MPLKLNTQCQNCGKPMYKSPKRLAAGERSTCSIECRKALGYADGRPRIRGDINCEVCGKSFRPTAINRKYCSRECYYTSQHRRQILVCEQCGKAFQRHDYQMRRQGKHIYCSKVCTGLGRQKRIDQHCAVCGKAFKRRPSELRWHNVNGVYFCCRAHSTAYRLLKKGINGLEKDFLYEFPELRYTGDGKFWINDDKGPMCPDFTVPYTNKIIEVWGNYWHRGQNPNHRIERLNNKGFECLVIWEKDFRQHIEEVRTKVSAFITDRA